MTQLSRLLAAVDACTDRLEQLHMLFPDLSSDEIEQSIDAWRSIRPRIEVSSTTKVTKNSAVTLDQKIDKASATENRERVRKIAIDLLDKNGLEDTLDILHSRYNVDLKIKNLIVLVGKHVYLKALQEDALLLRENAISYKQIAELWNDLERPAFGGINWTPQTVSMLLD